MADRNMMLTPDEYMSLMRLLASAKESEGAQLSLSMSEKPSVETKSKRRSRSARAQDKKLSRALAQANDKLRKNNGELRKGVTQADIMILAHRIKKTL